jgi:hypothetical protein
LEAITAAVAVLPQPGCRGSGTEASVRVVMVMEVLCSL